MKRIVTEMTAIVVSVAGRKPVTSAAPNTRSPNVPPTIAVQYRELYPVLVGGP